jgi:hypothetical protein
LHFGGCCGKIPLFMGLKEEEPSVAHAEGTQGF